MDIGWPPNLSKLSLARLGIPISKTFDFQSDHSTTRWIAFLRRYAVSWNSLAGGQSEKLILRRCASSAEPQIYGRWKGLCQIRHAFS